MLASIIVLVMFGPSTAATFKLRALPRAGDLVARVKDQLASDHQALGQVSTALMSVQSEVDKTEESMLGKVLDLQTARSFFTRHEEIDTANAKKTDEISKLNNQVEGLSSNLNKVQKEFLSNSQANRQSEGKLHTQSVENDAFIGSMNQELAKKDTVQQTLAKLTGIHQNLLAEGVNVSAVGANAEEMLHKARGGSSIEVGKHKSLRAQLVRMNNYSIACHASVTKAGKKLGMLMISASKDNQASKLTLTQKKRAIDAAEQRLLAERALLVTETKKAETEAVGEVEKLKDLRADLQTLGSNIVSEVRALEAKIKAEKERVKTLSVDLMENSQAEMEHNEQKEAMEDHLKKLIQKVHDDENPILIATTEAQNDALQSELNEAYVLWKDDKTSETSALLNVDQASAQAAANQASLKMADESIATARKEGRLKVAQAVKIAAKSKAKSQVQIQKAEAAVAERCKPKWDAIWKKKRTKLVKCKAMKESLIMEKAKKDTLTETLKASAMDELSL